MIPIIDNTPYRRLSIDVLSGGVNLRDGIHNIKDDQLTQCLNVEFKNGMLRSRPAFRHIGKSIETNNTKKVYTKKDLIQVVDGETFFLTVIQDSTGLDFRLCSDVSTNSICRIDAEDLPKTDYNCNILQYGGDIFCICSGYYEDPDLPFYVFEIFNDGEKWEYKRLTDDDIYIPLIAINAQAASPNKMQTDEALFGGDLIEGSNLLTRRVRYWYSSVNERRLEVPVDAPVDGTPVHRMEYWIPIDSAIIKNKKDRRSLLSSFKVNLTGSDGTTVSHTVDQETPGEVWEESKFKEDGLRLLSVCLNGPGIQFQFFNSEGMPAVTAADLIENNMEIILYSPRSKEEIEKVVNMTFSEFFGGDSEGIYGGIHLFLGGNTKKKEKALVCWSDMNKPLYFPDSGCAYVGDKSQRVTAFGRQGESLIIFKEREIYATKYTSNSSISADSVIAQAVVDVTEFAVTFPMTQVHGYIGCDCPNSVQLCRNRLVWAHSDGKVYTLVSANQYNERSIFELSAMVEKRFNKKDLEKAVSADYDGKYMLLCGKDLFVMDYDSYGYSSIAYYSKNDDAQSNIPWWIWKLPDESMKAASMVTVGDKFYLWAQIEQTLWIFTLGGDKDLVNTEQAIPCMVATKHFDFGAPTLKKSFPKAEMSFGNNGGILVTVTTTTDKGESVADIIPDGDQINPDNPNFFNAVALRNENKISRSIGYRIESDGGFALGGIALIYKILGGAN